jgi:hypothetical protein
LFSLFVSFLIALLVLINLCIIIGRKSFTLIKKSFTLLKDYFAFFEKFFAFLFCFQFYFIPL